MKKKTIKILAIIVGLIVFLAIVIAGKMYFGSKTNKTTEAIKTNDLAYLLTSKSGKITGFKDNGKEYMSLDISTGNSDYIYVEDEGVLYHPKLKDNQNVPKVLYALDRNKSTVTVLRVTNNKIERIEELGIKDGQKIKDMKAINGTFYYSIEANGLKAKRHTFKHGKSDKGETNFNVSLPKNHGNSNKTYVISEDFTDEYMEAMNIGLSEEDFLEAGVKPSKTNIIELPYLVDDWTTNDEYVYFFIDGHMGQYDLEKDQISMYYGSKDTIESVYISGINSRVLSLSSLGENGGKSTLMTLDPDHMKVQSTIEIKEPEPLTMKVLKNDLVYIAYKNKQQNAKTLTRIYILDYATGNTKKVLPVEYTPTKLEARGSTIAVFNEDENYFLYGNNESKELSKFKTKYDDVDYTDIFMFDFNYKTDYNFDKEGNLLNKKNQRIDKRGNLLNNNNERINSYGQLVNEYNRPINKNGEYIDRYNNILNEDGSIKKYVKGEDGNYRNTSGQLVTKEGKLVRNEKAEQEKMQTKTSKKVTNKPQILTDNKGNKLDIFGNTYKEDKVVKYKEQIDGSYRNWKFDKVDKNGKVIEPSLTEEEVIKELKDTTRLVEDNNNLIWLEDRKGNLKLISTDYYSRQYDKNNNLNIVFKLGNIGNIDLQIVKSDNLAKGEFNDNDLAPYKPNTENPEEPKVVKTETKTEEVPTQKTKVGLVQKIKNIFKK